MAMKVIMEKKKLLTGKMNVLLHCVQKTTPTLILAHNFGKC